MEDRSRSWKIQHTMKQPAAAYKLQGLATQVGGQNMPKPLSVQTSRLFVVARREAVQSGTESGWEGTRATHKPHGKGSFGAS